MGWTNRYAVGLKSVYLGALTTSGANESRQAAAPSALIAAFLQDAKAASTGSSIPLTQYHQQAEVWRPVGVLLQTTTSTTVTIPALTLRKNGVSAATGGVATMGALRTAPFAEFIPFTAYTFAAADAAGDKWSVLVTTTSTAGAVEVHLFYATISVAGISDAITTL
jgi:hypothetical protein